MLMLLLMVMLLLPLMLLLLFMLLLMLLLMLLWPFMLVLMLLLLLRHTRELPPPRPGPPPLRIQRPRPPTLTLDRKITRHMPGGPAEEEKLPVASATVKFGTPGLDVERSNQPAAKTGEHSEERQISNKIAGSMPRPPKLTVVYRTVNLQA